MERARQVEVVRPVSTVDAVARTLRQQILDGTLAAGSPLREAEISTGFKVSRHTVRSALQVLVHEGIARHAANRGVFVPAFTGDEITEMFGLREILEIEAVNHVVLGAGDLAGPQAALESLRLLPADADWGTVRDADLAIHRALIETLENGRIVRTYDALMAELRLSMLPLRPEFEHRNWVVRQHEDLLTALQERDGNRAAHWIRNHNAESIADITGGMSEPSPQP
jgi:DNA-binding GntR family transcriptional regulator